MYWVRSSKHDLSAFPEAVKDGLGAALSVAQFGGKHPNAKPWKGEGTGVFEVVDNYRGDAYRAVYAVRFQHALYVLHGFQKNSPSGIKTALSDVKVIRERLKLAKLDYEERYGETKK